LNKQFYDRIINIIYGVTLTKSDKLIS